MVRICLNVKSQRTKKSRTDDSKTLRCEPLYIGDYEYVSISSFPVLGIKLWLEEDGDLREGAKGKVFARDPIFGGSCVPKPLPLKDNNTTGVPQAARKIKR